MKEAKEAMADGLAIAKHCITANVDAVHDRNGWMLQEEETRQFYLLDPGAPVQRVTGAPGSAVRRTPL
jgi:hypothetical protein